MRLLSLEGFLARLYSDARETDDFLGNREGYARKVGLAPAEWIHVMQIDAAALRFAASSYERKRCGPAH